MKAGLSEEKKKVGRPTTYTEQQAIVICARIAEGESLRSVCRDPLMPATSTVFQWLGKQKVFADQYGDAMAARASALFDELLEIADDGTNDYIQTEDGDKFNSEHVQRSRLRIDTRKWVLSKMVPKKYNDKAIVGIDLEIKQLELEKLRKEVRPEAIRAPDEDYKIPLPVDEEMPDEPIL